MTVREACAGRMCFLCKLIAEDLERNGRLTDDYPPQGPLSYQFDALFPVGAKIIHLVLERIPVDFLKAPVILSVE